MEKYYLEFEDTEENKLVYTHIFNEYVSVLLLALNSVIVVGGIDFISYMCISG